MKYEIIDNFLPPEKFEHLKTSVINCNWKMNENVANVTEYFEMDNNLSSSYYFTHAYYLGFLMDENIRIFKDVLSKLKVRSIIRIKANLYPSTNQVFDHQYHIDYDYEHFGAILSLNTCDGYTRLEDGTKIESVANRVLLFDPSKPHSSSTCTNDKYRCNVSFNYF